MFSQCHSYLLLQKNLFCLSKRFAKRIKSDRLTDYIKVLVPGTRKDRFHSISNDKRLTRTKEVQKRILLGNLSL